MSVIVRPDGPIPARIMIVGEAPGADEEALGVPFVGVSGKELNRMLHEAGITRSECFVTNVCRIRPLGNDIETLIALRKKDITPAHTSVRDKYVLPPIVQGIEMLRQEIESVKPNVIIALGNVPMWALTGNWGITKWRGSLLRTDLGSYPAKVIPTYHPAAVLRQWDWRSIAVHDLRKVAQHRNDLQYQEPKWRFTIRPSFVQTIHQLDRLLAMLDEASGWFDFDIETRMGHIACAGISWSLEDAICVPLMCAESKEGYWRDDYEEAAVTWRIYKILTHPNVKVRGQNLLYDSQYTYRHWHFIPKVAQDTMISHHVAFAGLPKKLDFQASMYCKHYVYWKDDGKEWNTKRMGEDALWSYNCVDCVRTREVGEAEAKTIESLNLQEVERFQQELFWPVLQAMNRGVRVDTKARNEMAMELQEELDKREAYFISILGHSLNPRSPQQMMKLFYDDLKLPIQIKRGTGRPTLDDEALNKLGAREPLVRPFLKKIAEHRSLGVFLSTFVKAPLDEDGRMRCSFNICGAETYRFSSSENAFGSGCVPGDTEVLTRNGWLQIALVQNGDYIAQWDEKNISFVPAEPYRTQYRGLWYHGKGEQFEVCLTADHRVIYYDKYFSTKYEAPAKRVATKSNICLPISGIQNGPLTVSWARLLVATLADGSYEGNLVRLSFKKTRKIERIIKLFTAYNVDWWENAARPGYRRFVFRRPNDWPEEKKWGWWITGLQADIAQEMLQEARYWDATERGTSFWFFSADREQAEILATLAHLTGNGATVRRQEQSASSWSDTTMWVVNVKPRSYARLKQEHWKTEFYSGEVFCVTVPSSYFLIRYKGKISITGNTNLQNIPKGVKAKEPEDLELPNVRKLFIPDPGFTFFDMDLDRADLQVVVWEAEDKKLKEALRLGIDMHCLNACDIFDIKGIPYEELTETHPNYNEHRERIGSMKRQLAKTGVHAVDYGCKARTLSVHLGSTVHEADKFINKWLSAHPGIKTWHTRIESQINTRRYVENRFGYRRFYFDRPDGVLPEALAWIPQSTVACTINRVWMNVYKNLPEIWVLLQVHDSLAGQFPTHLKDWAIRRLKEEARIVIPYEDPLIIPVGIKTSEVSWGDCH